MGIRYAKAPLAPYMPLGGWYNPGADPHARTRPMWFQKDCVDDPGLRAALAGVYREAKPVDALKSVFEYA